MVRCLGLRQSLLLLAMGTLLVLLKVCFDLTLSTQTILDEPILRKASRTLESMRGQPSFQIYNGVDTLDGKLMIRNESHKMLDTGGRPEMSTNLISNDGSVQHSVPRWVTNIPTLYIITPTYPRAEQVPELTRTAQTLMNVANVFWIVSEDAAEPTPAVQQYLKESGLTHVYLRVEMPQRYLKAKNKPRGVANRNAGLAWIREHAVKGVFYFADDDNTYDIRLFEQMRFTQKVSMFPVGLVTKLGVSTPIVKNGHVIGFYDGWIAGRKYPIDMAGFAVNVEFFLTRLNATMPFKVGHEEDGFMQSLHIQFSDIEALADNCTKIWVWHTQTKKNNPAKAVPRNSTTIGTNLEVLENLLWTGPTGQTEKPAVIKNKLPIKKNNGIK